MTPRSTPTCAHERRPGTTVCLRCRHEELVASRTKLRQSALKLVLTGGAAALVIGGVVSGASALMSRGSSQITEVTVERAPEPVPRPSFAVTQSGEVAQPAAAATRPKSPATAPAIPHGTTPLAAGFTAERSGDTVRVTFDTQDGRTRRSDKFENVVRETLPVVFGDAGRSAVDRLPAGGLVPPGELLSTLDGAPLVIPVGDGRTIRLTPGARAGRDGPLVVTYRAVIEPASAPSRS